MSKFLPLLRRQLDDRSNILVERTVTVEKSYLLGRQSLPIQRYLT